MSTIYAIRGPWLALLEINCLDVVPEGPEPWVQHQWEEVYEAISGLVEQLPAVAEQQLIVDLQDCADAIARMLKASDLWDATDAVETVLIALRGALAGTAASRYRSALLQLRRLLNDWWEQQESKQLIYAVGQEPACLADLPYQAVNAAFLGLPSQKRRGLSETLMPRLARQLQRWHQRDEEQRAWLERARRAQADEVMARRKLGLPEEGSITLLDVETALAAVVAGEPEAHPNRKRRWQQAAENLRLLIRLEQRDQI